MTRHLPVSRRVALLGATLTIAAAHAAPAAAVYEPPSSTTDPVLAWFDATAVVLPGAGLNVNGSTQSAGSRTWAVAWAAADHAIAALPTSLTTRGRQVATKSALITAVRDVLWQLTPGGREILDETFHRTSYRIPTSAAKTIGRKAGAAAAADELKARAGDGFDLATINAPFTPPTPALGTWRPTPPALAGAVQSGQGKAKPFLIPDVATSFLADPPPAIDSPTEITDLQEIVRVGGATSTERTPEQTETARFWSQTSLAGYTPILRALIGGTGRAIAPRVHLIAAFHQVTVDAQIAIFASKYTYLRWRPVTAIRTDDGNPATPLDTKFTPLLATPAHPEYPSGHTGYAGAAEEVLTELVGKGPKTPIRVNSVATPDVYKTYSTWAQVTQDNIDARVWSGIHLRSTDTYGAAYGKRIAAEALKKLKG